MNRRPRRARRRWRTGCLAIVLTQAVVSGAAGTPRAVPRAVASDEAFTQALRDLRAAERTGDPSAVEGAAGRLDAALGGSPDEGRAESVEQAIARRIALARAVTADVAAGVAADGESERARASERLRIAARVEGDDPVARACRTEWRLEAVEDLLLRAMPVRALDAAAALSCLANDERATLEAIGVEARTALSQVDADCSGTPGADPAATIATDPLAFRRAALDGLVATLECDLARLPGPTSDGRRPTPRSIERANHAAGRLALAARCELPLPRALAEILALAEARMLGESGRGGSDPARRRADRLAVAARSADPAIELVARIEQWRDGPRDRPFPTPLGDSRVLAVLAAWAEAGEQRLDSGLEAVDAPLRALLARESRREREPAARGERLSATGSLLAARLPAVLAARAGGGDAPTTVAALVAAGANDATLVAWPAERLEAIALDPLVAPLVAVRAVGALAARGDGEAASRLLARVLAGVEALPGDRALTGLLLDLRRADATRDAAGEVALDDALAIALARHPADADATTWALARIDLALLPLHTLPNPARAAERLGELPRSAVGSPAAELRAIEAEELGIPARGTAGLAPLAARIERLRSALGEAPPAEIAARVAVVEARVALREGRAAEARRIVVDALETPGLPPPAIVRACDAWAEAVSIAELGDGTRATSSAESSVRNALARTPMAAATLAGRLDRTADLLDDARRETNPDRARAAASRRARPLAEAMLAADPRHVPAGRLLALADLVEGRVAEAIERLDGLCAERPGDRALALALADALVADGAAEASARAFAAYRALSPLAADATQRDAVWWSAQLGQLEILAGDPKRRAEVLARLNRLAALEPGFGAARFRVPPPARPTTLEARFEAVRRRAAPTSP